jgi:hypothetical protein
MPVTEAPLLRGLPLYSGAFWLVMLWAPQASAYRTAADLPEYDGSVDARWATPRIPIELHADGVPGLVLGSVEDTVLEALSTWNGAVCSDLQFEYRGVTFSDAEPADGRNTIQWVTSGWSELGVDGNTAAATDVQYEVTEDGWEIVE